MQYGVLGPLEVHHDTGAAVEVAGARLRALLARLALDAGRSVSGAALVDAVWGDQPPAEQTNALQTLVSRLRRVLGSDAVVAVPGGYRLAADPADVDAHRFERLAADGGQAARAGEHRIARTLLTEALDLWRGPALADAGDTLATYATRLEELRLAAVVDRLETDLALGQPAGTGGIVPELESLIAEHPLHERLAALTIRALAASGRPADALAAYERVRTLLADQLGVDPSAELQQLHLALLHGTAEPLPAVPATRRTEVRTNVPAQLTSFVGRADEVSRIGKTLEANRLVTLVGPGGAGKTRLAAEAASRLLDIAADGVWLIELAPVTAGGDVAQAVVDALGLRETVMIDGRRMPTGDAMARLVDGLAEKNTILVLDNCEHLIESCALIADQLLARCADLRVVATSREPLGIVGEVLQAVPPLGAPEPTASAAEALDYPAVRLFADRAAAVRPGFEVDDASAATVIDVVRRLDGLPLAIELAAARLRSLPLAELADRLSDRFRLLTGGSRAALPRHRTLRAVVEWSWGLLPDDERDLVERLAVFPAGVTTDSATAISDGPPDDVPDLLAALVDKSLLQRVGDGRRLRMLETIREYGVERLAEQGELGAVRARHADHFAALLAEAGPHLLRSDQVPWIDLLRAERENLVAAMRHLGDVGQVDRALTMAVSLASYAIMLGLSDETSAWVSEALAFPGGNEDLRVLAEALRMMGMANAAQGDEAESSLQSIKSLAGRLGQVPDELSPWVHVLRIASSWYSEQLDLSENYTRQAAEHPDPWVRGTAALFRAMAAENAGDVVTMRSANAEARALFTEVGERWGLGSALRNAAQLALLDGDLDASFAIYEQALELNHQLHSRDDEGWLLARMADLQVRRGDLTGARSYIDRALASADEGGAQPEAAFALAMLAGVEQRAGDHESARRHQETALARLAALPREHPVQGHLRAVVLSASLRMAAEEGRLDDARAFAAESLEVAIGTRDMPVVANVGVSLAVLAGHEGRLSAAARMLGASDVLRGAPDPTALDVITLTRDLRTELGDAAFEAAYGEGAALDRDGALVALRDR